MNLAGVDIAAKTHTAAELRSLVTALGAGRNTKVDIHFLHSTGEQSIIRKGTSVVEGAPLPKSIADRLPKSFSPRLGGGGGGASGGGLKGIFSGLGGILSTPLRAGLAVLNWMSVLTASDEGSAAFGVLMVQLCRSPYLCAVALMSSLAPMGGETRQRMIDDIRSLYPSDPYGERAEDMIKFSCLYASAACRQ